MSFSSILIQDSFSDYISPSQECTKPSQPDKSGTPKVSLGDSFSINDNSIFQSSTLPEAKIVLEDCLACSGCITSAETVLISLQSHKQMIDMLNQNNAFKQAGNLKNVKIVVVSVSPQSRASIGAKYGFSSTLVHRKLTWFFKSIGVDFVFDTSFSRDLSLIESAIDFIERYKVDPKTPMLASACPGWICYAEKTHPELIPYISTAKSPQQVMGSIVKSYLPTKLNNVSKEDIFHVSVMPCYDKKLEASRQDFFDDVLNSKDVDCVLTTGEIEILFNEKGISISNCPESEIDPMFTKLSAIDPSTKTQTLLQTPGSSSGGYLPFIMQHAAKTLFNIHLSPNEINDPSSSSDLIQIVTGRNSDYKTILLKNPQNKTETLLTFTYAYGFRNIQNLVRKINPKKSTFRSSRDASSSSPINFVEIMACPSGCINGGGQLKVGRPVGGVEMSSGTVEAKRWIRETERVYRAGGDGGVDGRIEELCLDWFGGDVGLRRRVLRTGYRGVERVDSLAVKW